MQASLTVIDCDLSAYIGKRWILTEPKYAIGRVEGCCGACNEDDCIVVPTYCLSRNHMGLTPAGDGWSLIDVGSTNGVSINEQTIEQNKQHPLSHGMQISVRHQDAWVVFRYEEHE